MRFNTNFWQKYKEKSAISIIEKELWVKRSQINKFTKNNENFLTYAIPKYLDTTNFIAKLSKLSNHQQRKLCKEDNPIVQNWQNVKYAQQVISILLKNGININYQNNNGQTALILSLQNPYIIQQPINNIIEDLLKHKADVNIIDKYHKTAFDYLIENQLTAYKINNNNQYILSPLTSKIDIIGAKIINKNFEPNQYCHNGHTLLYNAININSPNIVKALINKGANPFFCKYENIFGLVQKKIKEFSKDLTNINIFNLNRAKEIESYIIESIFNKQIVKDTIELYKKSQTEHDIIINLYSQIITELFKLQSSSDLGLVIDYVEKYQTLSDKKMISFS